MFKIGGSMKNYLAIVAAVISGLTLSGCTETLASPFSDASNNPDTLAEASIDSTYAEEFLRQALYDSTGIGVIAECPEDMRGPEGSSFTCFACPELYAAAQVGGGYFYGTGITEFRCDAAYEGFAVDYEVRNGEMILVMENIRGTTQG